MYVLFTLILHISGAFHGYAWRVNTVKELKCTVVESQITGSTCARVKEEPFSSASTAQNDVQLSSLRTGSASILTNVVFS